MFEPSKVEEIVEMGTDAEDIETIGEIQELIATDESDLDNANGYFAPAGIITLVLSLVIALVVFFGIVMRKSAPKSKFVKWLKEFLNFRKIWVAGILKFIYIFLAALITIGGIVVMFYGKSSEPWIFVLVGLAMIIFGNIFLRLGFEMTMMMIGMWENTRDIRGALVKEEEKKEEE